MSLTIGNTVLDEELRVTQSGTADDSDVAVATFNASAFRTALDALSLTFQSSPTGFPQYAEKTDFVDSSNDPVVTNYFLTSNSNGDPFPAAGTATDLYFGANQIFLFATANPDIIVGRVGTGTTANPNGNVAIVIGVDETKSGGFVTQADMWMVQRVPLVEAGKDQVDSNDTLDLSGLVYLGSTFDTTTEVPFENFNGVPSGNNLFNVIFPSDANAGDVQLLLTGSTGETLSTVNVSSTGIGSGSQHIDVGYTLRIDTVSGMVKANVDSAPEVNNSNNIDYTARVDIVGADFEVTQVNPGTPSERVDVLISAFDAAGASQEGAYLTNAIAADGTPVQIDAADVHILDDAGNDITAAWLALPGTEIIQVGNSVRVEGLNDGTSSSKTDGDRVAFTTDGVHFDRFLVTNVDSSTTFDLGNVHVTAIKGGVDTEYGELGSHLIYEDDGPNIDPSGNTPPTITDDDSDFVTNNTGAFSGVFTTPDYGADASGTVSYILGVKSANVDSGLDETLTGQNILLSYDSATNTVFGKTAVSGAEVFRITVNSSGVVTLDQSLAIKHSDTTSSDETSSAMTSDLITLSAKVTDSEGTTTGDSDTATVNIGGSFLFKDDGPSLTPQAAGSLTPNDLQVDNDPSTLPNSDSSSYGLVPGADGQKSYSIVGPEDATGTFRWHYTTAGDPTAITGTFLDANSVSHNLYTLVLNPSTGAYTFTMTGSLPPTSEGLSSTIIHAGGPTDTIDVQAKAPSTDFGRIIADSTVGAGLVNASHGFVGVDNGNLDPNESLNLSLHEANGDLILISGITIGTKSAQTCLYDYFVTLSDNSVVQVGDNVAVAKGGTISVLDPNPNDALLIKSVTVTMVSGNAIKIGLGDINFLVPPDDIQLGFTVRLTDGDNDTADKSFTVDIDGNNDGSFDATVNSLSVLSASSTMSAIETLHHHEFADPHDAFAF